jgi:RNA polymerase sigma-70 factor (ECF subfamily)
MNLPTLFKTAPMKSTCLEARFHQGNMAALQEIIQTYQRGIYQLGLRLFFNRDIAADFSQDVFIRAYEKCRSYNPSRPLKPWLFQVATNLGRDRLRRKKEIILEEEQMPASETVLIADELLVKDELQRKVWNVVNGLSPTYREILALRFSSDLSLQEIADSLGINLSAAKVRLCRGLKAFEEAFKFQGGEGYVV